MIELINSETEYTLEPFFFPVSWLKVEEQVKPGNLPQVKIWNPYPAHQKYYIHKFKRFRVLVAVPFLPVDEKNIASMDLIFVSLIEVDPLSCQYDYKFLEGMRMNRKFILAFYIDHGEWEFG